MGTALQDAVSSKVAEELEFVPNMMRNELTESVASIVRGVVGDMVREELSKPEVRAEIHAQVRKALGVTG